MIYLENKDFYKVITKEELTDIVGPHDLPSDNGFSILEALEMDGISEMSGYLAVRYDDGKCFDATIDKIPIIVQKLVDIVLYNAYSAISPNNIPTLRDTRFTNALNWLEKVASGYINPNFPTKPEQPKTPLRFGSSQKKMNNFY